MGVRRLAGRVAGEQAAPLDHHAQAAEAEHLDLDVGVLDHVAHLVDRQHARQHRAHHAEALARKVDRLVVGRRALHRHVQTQFRVAAAGVIHQADVGEDHRVDAEVGGLVDSTVPA